MRKYSGLSALTTAIQFNDRWCSQRLVVVRPSALYVSGGVTLKGWKPTSRRQADIWIWLPTWIKMRLPNRDGRSPVM